MALTKQLDKSNLSLIFLRDKNVEKRKREKKRREEEKKSKKVWNYDY